MVKLKSLFQKYKEIIMYLIFGVLTTAVNFVIYVVLVNLQVNVYVTNVIAWIGAVLFAYFTNRKMVFNSQANGSKELVKEIISFYGARVFSLLVETSLLYVFISFFGMDEVIAKLILQVVVVVLNYIFSKFFVFKKEKKAET